MTDLAAAAARLTVCSRNDGVHALYANVVATAARGADVRVYCGGGTGSLYVCRACLAVNGHTTRSLTRAGAVAHGIVCACVPLAVCGWHGLVRTHASQHVTMTGRAVVAASYAPRLALAGWCVDTLAACCVMALLQWQCV